MRTKPAPLHLLIVFLFLPLSVHAEKNERALAYLEKAKQEIIGLLEKYPPDEVEIPLPLSDRTTMAAMDLLRQPPWILLADISRAQSRAGDHDAALDTLELLLDTFRKHRSTSEKMIQGSSGSGSARLLRVRYSRTVGEIIIIFSELGEYETAIEVAREEYAIRTTNVDWYLNRIATYQADAGDISAAIETLELSNRHPGRDQFLRVLVEKGEYDLALEFARKPEPDTDILMIAEHLLNSGDIDRASSILDEVRQIFLGEGGFHDSFRSPLVRLLIQSGKPSSALEFAMHSPPRDLPEFVTIFAEERDFERAITLAEKIAENRREDEFICDTTSAWISANITICRHLMIDNQRNMAAIIADRMLGVLEEYTPTARSERMRRVRQNIQQSHIIRLLATTGRTEKALEHIYQLTEDSYVGQEAMWLMEVLAIQISTGQIEDAEETLPILLNLLDSNPNIIWSRVSNGNSTRRWLMNALSSGGNSDFRFELLDVGAFSGARTDLIISMALASLNEDHPASALEIAFFIEEPLRSKVECAVAEYFKDSGEIQTARLALDVATLPIASRARFLFDEGSPEILSGPYCQAFRYISATRGKLGFLEEAEESINELPADLGKAYGWLGLAEGILSIGVLPPHLYDKLQRVRWLSENRKPFF